MTAVATEVADQIVALRVELAETLDGLKDEEAGWQPGPGPWCVLEVVAHLLGREGAGGVRGTRRRLVESPDSVHTHVPGEADLTGRMGRTFRSLTAALPDQRGDFAAQVAALSNAPLEPPISPGDAIAATTIQEWLNATVAQHLPDHLAQIPRLATRMPRCGRRRPPTGCRTTSSAPRRRTASATAPTTRRERSRIPRPSVRPVGSGAKPCRGDLARQTVTIPFSSRCQRRARPERQACECTMDAAGPRDLFLDLLLALAFGAAVGIEREVRRHEAGFRTIALVTVGAAAFGLLSDTFLESDARVAAGVVQGIGFLGAGIIFQRGDALTGLTTTATVWAMAAVGLLVAQELRLLALRMTLQVLVMLEARAVWRLIWVRARHRVPLQFDD